MARGTAVQSEAMDFASRKRLGNPDDGKIQLRNLFDLNPARADQTVTFTARISVLAPGGGSPGGDVAFYNGSTLVGTATVVADGTGYTAALSTTLAGGDHQITARYAGTANHSASASSPLVQTVFGAPAEPGRPENPGPPANPPGGGRGRGRP